MSGKNKIKLNLISFATLAQIQWVAQVLLIQCSPEQEVERTEVLQTTSVV